jgi:DNA-binding LacI/PurR family transcriptional regulator
MMPLAPDSRTGLTSPHDVAQAVFVDTRDRALGFLDVFGASGLLTTTAVPDVEHGARAARLLLDRPKSQRPTGIVAQSDLLAAGVVRAAEELGLRVPEDLSVTGFDGVDLPWFPGTLTTIDQQGVAKGRRLGALLQRLLDGERPRDELQPTTLRLGTTTAPAPG